MFNDSCFDKLETLVIGLMVSLTTSAALIGIGAVFKALVI